MGLIVSMSLLILLLNGSCWASLCARAFKSSSPTESWNFTLDGTGVASAILMDSDFDTITLEYQCRVDLGRKNGSIWRPSRSTWKLRRNQDPVRYGLTSKNNAKPVYVCCTCHPQTCDMVQLDGACAVLFSDINCNTCFTKGLKVYAGDSDPDMTYGTDRNPQKNFGITGRNGILSTVVNWGCKLTLYEKKDYLGSWRFLYNGADERFGNFGNSEWGNTVGSYKCECPVKQSQGQAVGDWITLVTNSSAGMLAPEANEINSTIIKSVDI